MKILITGATGFLGSRLSLRLADEGHIIHALYRSKTKNHLLMHRNIRLFKGDVTDKASVLNAMESCACVYHLAAYARVWSNDASKYQRVNYEGTRNVLESAEKLGIRRMVCTSTAGVFGPSLVRTVDETVRSAITPCTQYEQTKAKADRLVKDFVRRGMDIVIVHPTRVFGPGPLNQSNSVTRMIDLYTKGKFRFFPGDGNSVGNYAFVDDIVDGHILAMRKGRSGEQYILGGTNVSYREFFRIISDVSGRQYLLIPLPISFMLVVSNLMLFLAKITRVSPLITPPWVKKYNYNWETTSQKSMKHLGYRITPLDEGIRKTINYLKTVKLSA